MGLQHFDKDCLYSTVKNTAVDGNGDPVAKTFGFLPPHGAKLDADEEYTIFGNILDRLQTQRDKQAFAAAIDRGDIAIVATPSPILVNANGVTKMIKLNTNNTLSAVDPCWTESDSLDINAPV